MMEVKDLRVFKNLSKLLKNQAVMVGFLSIIISKLTGKLQENIREEAKSKAK